MGESTLIASTAKLTRQQLTAVQTPVGTATHRPVPHAEVIEALVETLGFRHIAVVNEEFAISKDGMKMFGVLDLDTGMHGCRFSIGLRNAHDKSMRLAMTVGYRVFVCENMAFSGDFQPVLAKHSKNFSLQNALSIGVDQMQRNFDGMRKHLMLDFTHIDHIDLHGNVRKNPKLSGTTHNVFGIQVGVGITVAVRCSGEKRLRYHRVAEF